TCSPPPHSRQSERKGVSDTPQGHCMPLTAELPKAQTSYLPISVTTLRPDHSIGISLYLRVSGADSLILYRERGIALTVGDLASLAIRGMRTLFVTCDDFDIYQKYL